MTKGDNGLLGRTYFTGDDDYQNFFVFTPMLNSLILDNKRKVTIWVSTGVSTKNIKPFDVNLAATMNNFANGRVSLKFCSVLVKGIFSSF